MTQMLSPKAYAEFILMLGRLGITPENLRQALRERPLSGDILDPLREHPSFQLAHDQYHSTESVRDRADQEVRKAGYMPELFSWVNDHGHMAPEFTDDPGVAIVLVYHLDTLEETMRMLCKCITDSHDCFTLEGIPLDRNHLRRIQDPEHMNFQPRTRRWARVKLDAHLGKTPDMIRANVKKNTVAGIEVLCAVAQHPYLFLHNLDSKPWFNLCGLNVQSDTIQPPRILSLKIDVPDDHVSLFTADATLPRAHWFNPVLV